MWGKKVSGEKKGDICDACNNKDFLKRNRDKSGKRHEISVH